MIIPRFIKRLWPFFAIAAVAIITYSNALRSEFLMDDLWMFQPDRIAYVKAQVESVVLNKPIPENLKDFMIDLSYRPLSQILPLANYLLFKNNVLGYHIVNLILFILCALMIFLFLQTLFDDFFI
jgi:hypothetical protein